MKKTHIPHSFLQKWLTPLIVIFTLSLLLFLSLSLINTGSPQASAGFFSRHHQQPHPYDRASSLPSLPRFAYLITGTQGDGARVRRLLQAVYHPRNYYLIHLDLEAAESERLELAGYVKSEGAIREFRNVMVIGNADLVTAKGPTAIASTLHAIAILLKRADDWDWFINLSASDYPLVSQDDLLHTFSYLPRDLNFLEHSGDLDWKEFEQARPIIIDPGLYHSKKSGVFYAKERRSLPASFKLFMGNPPFAVSETCCPKLDERISCVTF